MSAKDPGNVSKRNKQGLLRYREMMGLMVKGVRLVHRTLEARIWRFNSPSLYCCGIGEQDLKAACNLALPL